MTHDPECFSETDRDICICDLLKSAYQRGYLAGYNAHATAALEWKATHGAYPKHGKGENP